MSRIAYCSILLAAIAFAHGCGPAASSREMKDLQSRLDLVQLLGEIQRGKTVKRSDVDGIAAYVQTIAINDENKRQITALSDKLFHSRKSPEKIDELTQAMKRLVQLPEKYSKAYGL